MAATEVQCTVTSFRMLTPTVFELAFEPSLPIEFKAGQFISIVIPGAGPKGRDLRRAYSIASAPCETARHGWLEFLVKVDGSSRFGALVETLSSDTHVSIDGPSGLFTLDSVAPGTPVLFIAGGTGIAPVRSPKPSIAASTLPPPR